VGGGGENGVWTEREINRGGGFRWAPKELEWGVWWEGVIKKMLLATEGGQRHVVRGLRMEKGIVETL